MKLWFIEKARSALRDDTAIFRDSATAVAGMAGRANADLKAGGWRMLWAALRGHPPALTPDAERGLTKLFHLLGGTFVAFGLYVGVMGAMGFLAVAFGALAIAVPTMIGAGLCSLLLRGPRVPPDRWLEYRPEPPFCAE